MQHIEKVFLSKKNLAKNILKTGKKYRILYFVTLQSAIDCVILVIKHPIQGDSSNLSPNFSININFF